jgi:hypothetical protein
VILAGYMVLNFIVDNVVKPRIMQSGLDVPPLLGVLSLVCSARPGRSWPSRSPSRSAACSTTPPGRHRRSPWSRPSRRAP